MFAYKVCHLLYRGLQRVMVLEAITVMVARTKNVAPALSESYQTVSLDQPALQKHIEKGEAPYCEALCERLGEDANLFCFGVVSEERLLSFSWFFIGSAEAKMNYGRCEASATSIQLQADTAFVFHSFTAPEARGKRLMALLLQFAAKSLREDKGVTHLVATTDLTNRAARATFDRAGFDDAGSYWRFGWGNMVAGKYPSPVLPIVAYGKDAEASVPA